MVLEMGNVGLIKALTGIGHGKCSPNKGFNMGNVGLIKALTGIV